MSDSDMDSNTGCFSVILVGIILIVAVLVIVNAVMKH